MAYEKIKNAISQMCSVCDGAISKDNVGFRKGDSYKGHYLLWCIDNEQFTYYHAITAYKLLFPLYKNQLVKVHGINYIEFPENENNEPERRMSINKEDLDMIKSWNQARDIERVYYKNQYRKLSVESIDVSNIIRKYIGDIGDYIVHGDEIFKVIKDYTPKSTELTVDSVDSLVEMFFEIEGTLKGTSRGDRILKNSSMPNGFWDLWKTSKTELKDLGFSPSKYSGVWELNQWCKIEAEEIEEPEVVETPEIDIDLNDTNLYDYQKPHVAKLIESFRTNGYALDGSGTGTGKTFSNLNVCKKLGLRPLIICPKNVIPSWEKSIKTLDMEVLGVVNYALIRKGKFRIEKGTISRGYNKGKPKKVNVNCPYLSVETNIDRKSKYDSKYIMKWDLPEKSVIIFDEAHRCKNNKTLNTQMMIEAANNECKILMLSATIGENPLKMSGVARVMNFYEKPWEFYTKFASNYDCYKNRFGWTFDGGNRTMERLHNEIYGKGKGSRMDTDELRAKGLFPETQIIFEAYNMNGAEKKINKAYENMFKSLSERVLLEAEIERTKNSIKNNENEQLIEKLNELQSKKASMESPLSIRQKTRQIAEIEKVPCIAEMAQDYIEEGHSVAIFVNYTDTLEALKTKLKTDCCIYGKNSSSMNEANRLLFENNGSRVIVCNVAASREGIDLHDKFNKFSRVSLISPDDSAQNIKQVLGRVDRSGGTASLQRIIFAANTIEEMVLENARVKIMNINSLNGVDDSIWENIDY